MTLFETYAILSLTLAFGIPTFFDKVMRSGYERRVYSFRQSIREEYQESLREAVRIFEQAKELTDEIIEKMDYVTDAWVDVRNNYMKLDDLLKYIRWLFVGWMLSLVASLPASYVQEFQTMPFNLTNVNWLDISHLAFFIMLAATIWYGQEIFKFDRELSKFSKIERGLETRLPPTPVITSITMEKDVENALTESGIPYEVDVKIDRLVYDIVIPNIKNPQFFVEIKYLPRPISFITFDRVALKFIATKNTYPNSKTVLITNINNLHPQVKGDIDKYADKVFDLDNLQKFIKFVKDKLV